MTLFDVFGAEFRQVAGGMKNGAATRIVQVKRIYRTDPVDLWQAITDSQRLERWLLPVSGDLKLGGHYQLQGHAGGVIEQCNPPEQLKLTWEYGDNISWLSVTLESQDESTLLTLEHEMPTDPDSEAHWARFGAGATGVGWDLTLQGLNKHVNRDGDDAGSQANEAWAASAEGHKFIAASAKAWGQAQILSGEQEAIAQSQVIATTNFYTGAQ